MDHNRTVIVKKFLVHDSNDFVWLDWIKLESFVLKFRSIYMIYKYFAKLEGNKFIDQFWVRYLQLDSYFSNVLSHRVPYNQLNLESRDEKHFGGAGSHQ